MTRISWDAVGERVFETGVDRGVLYIPDSGGLYSLGVAWNGLTGVTEKPTGAAATPQYADNIKYLNLTSSEDFSATVEALTYPAEFAQFDGSVVLSGGVSLGQQARRTFGLSYRTRVGNDVSGTDLGYKVHLVYGCQAAPSERPYTTINDSPEALAFSWDLSTTPVSVTGQRPTAIVTVDSSRVTAANMTLFENTVWGTASKIPRLPLPDEVIGLFAGSLVLIANGPVTPTYNATTKVVTIPTQASVTFRVNGVVNTTGTYTIPTGGYAVVEASPTPGYTFGDTPYQTRWVFGPA